MKPPKHGPKVLSVLCVLVFGVWLSGCGGGATPATAVTAEPSPQLLNGNWLLAGTLPVFGPPGISGFGIAAAFNVVGDQITGGLTGAQQCGNIGSSVTLGTVTGTVAADGSFTLQTPARPTGPSPLTVTITGKVPSAPGAGWSGRYTITEPSANTCPLPTTGAVAATAIPLLSGTYQGTASFLPSSSGGTVNFGNLPSGTATPVSVTLQQQNQASANTAPQFGALYIVSGTIAVQDFPCASAGAVGGTIPVTGSLLSGSVIGNSFSANFQMSDGSTLVTAGSIAALDSSKIEVELHTRTAGNCAAQIAGYTTLSH